jgi:phosphatidylserine/phosphatidylglycerophosphate/cardiolipin synthase-like enzyme
VIKPLFNKDIKPELQRLLSQAKASIKIAVAWFNDADLFAILKAKNNDVHIVVVIVNDKTNNSRGNNFADFIDANKDFYFANSQNLMHHKFCIIDNEILITGSYNWTRGAKSNHENVLLIESASDVVSEYSQKFDDLIFNKHPLTKEEYVHSKDESLDLSAADNIQLLINEAEEELEKGDLITSLTLRR